LDQVEKAYPGGVKAVDELSLDIADGEFMVLVGPSGCGKSTALRSIAGLEEITAGTITIGDRVVNDLPPKDRDIAMVFQNYALYPHMTVEQNLAFGLQLRKTPKEEIRRRVTEAAKMLGLEPYLRRKPAALSGGQRQRVAIGRALVKLPKLFLLDEPLSNLDAALRLRTRVELAQLKQKVDAAVIMVTHDQAEAMTLADRIVVMNDRRIQQVGAPMDIYSRPANVFVAQFVGSPAMTLLHVTLADGDGPARVKLGEGSVVQTAIPRETLPAGELRLGLRPEAVRVADGTATTRAKVELVERLGERALIYARLPDGQPITAEDSAYSRLSIGDEVALAIDGATAHLFGPDGTGYHGTAAA
jgi:multiple sugar transport system ATP-binding protein